ncbi:hypothetical protein [Burkholderia metallica]|uniref:hypothetical protein n=1 Tax=Burkholderia metallica TaxID=488729 RepID=UPI001CF5A6C5|nr:hypothetical protein [Burkholderia metallica]MCA8018091.1 hypothetical protein [Burkholderia metallica]
MTEEQKPGLIGEIVDGVHKAEEALGNMFRGSDAGSGGEPVQEAGGAESGNASSAAPAAAPADSSLSKSSASETQAGSQVAADTADAPAVAASGENAASAAASTSLIESASPVLPASLAGAAAVVGTFASDQIKARLASIKQQLSVHHFEQSLVDAIHADLDAIEGML